MKRILALLDFGQLTSMNPDRHLLLVVLPTNYQHSPVTFEKRILLTYKHIQHLGHRPHTSCRMHVLVPDAPVGACHGAFGKQTYQLRSARFWQGKLQLEKSGDSCEVQLMFPLQEAEVT